VSLDLLDIDTALGIVLEHAPALDPEAVPPSEADGRYLAAPLRAEIDLPPFTNSATDGPVRR
jgi:molybdopterin molybdotransferase